MGRIIRPLERIIRRLTIHNTFQKRYATMPMPRAQLKYMNEKPKKIIIESFNEKDYSLLKRLCIMSNNGDYNSNYNSFDFNSKYLLRKDDYLMKLQNEQFNKPSRLRLFRKMLYNIETKELWLSDSTSFEQDVSDLRKEKRDFTLLSHKFINQAGLYNILDVTSQYASCFHNYNEQTSFCEVNIHLVRQIAYPGQSSGNAPEGCHQDGADFIMSALVLNLSNVTESSGVSMIYSNDNQYLNKSGIAYDVNNPLIMHQLQEGQGLIHCDKSYWHNITPIESKDGINEAYRDIIGLDFNFHKNISNKNN